MWLTSREDIVIARLRLLVLRFLLRTDAYSVQLGKMKLRASDLSPTPSSARDLVQTSVGVMRVDVAGSGSALGVSSFCQHLDGKGLDDVERGGQENRLVLPDPVFAAKHAV